MRTQADLAEVVTALREYADGYEYSLEGSDWQLVTQIGAKVGITVEFRSREHQLAADRLRGQLGRALNKLAEEGALVKVSDGHAARFYTPAGKARHDEAARKREERQLAELDQRRQVSGRLKAPGLQGACYTDNFSRIVVDASVMLALLDMAEG